MFDPPVICPECGSNFVGWVKFNLTTEELQCFSCGESLLKRIVNNGIMESTEN